MWNTFRCIGLPHPSSVFSISRREERQWGLWETRNWDYQLQSWPLFCGTLRGPMCNWDILSPTLHTRYLLLYVRVLHYKSDGLDPNPITQCNCCAISSTLLFFSAHHFVVMRLQNSANADLSPASCHSQVNNLDLPGVPCNTVQWVYLLITNNHTELTRVHQDTDPFTDQCCLHKHSKIVACIAKCNRQTPCIILSNAVVNHTVGYNLMVWR